MGGYDSLAGSRKDGCGAVGPWGRKRRTIGVRIFGKAIRLTVGFHMGFGFVATLGFVAAACVVAIASFLASRDTIDTIVSDRIPVIGASLHLAEQTGALAAEAVLLVNAPDPYSRDTVYQSLLDRGRLLKDQLEKLRDRGAPTDRLAVLSEAVEKFLRDAHVLNTLVARRNELDRRQEGLYASLATLGATLPVQLERTPDQTDNIVPIEGAVIMLMTALDSPNKARLLKLQAEFLALMPKKLDVEPAAAVQTNQPAPLRRALTSLHELGSGPHNVFAVREELLDIHQNIAGRFTSFKHNAELLTFAANDLFSQVERDIDRQATETKNDLAQTTWLLIGIAAVSTLVVVGVFLHLDRHVVRRLNALHQSMRKHGLGEHVAIDTRGTDEIADMAKSLEYFTETIESREDALKLARDEAEQANRAKSRFLAAASHDLRQPFQAMALYVDLLSKDEMSDAPRDLVERIERSMESFSDLLNGILDISKLEAGVLKPEKHFVPLANLLGRLRDEFEPVVRRKGLRMAHEPFCDATILTDPILMERIVRNLLTNAVRYTEKGEIALVCHCGGESAVIEVRDTGIGIPADQQDKIFNEFYQVGSNEPLRREGLGLGLSIVSRLCRLLDHRLKVSSTPGVGSVFSVSVPLAAPSGDIEAKPAKTAKTRVRPLDILLVDDDTDVLHGMAMTLQSWGHTVVTAESADVALEDVLARNAVPDLVVTDYRLDPSATGLDLLEALEDELRCHIPALIVTADTELHHIERIRQAGRPYLQKPVSAGALSDAIAELAQATSVTGKG